MLIWRQRLGAAACEDDHDYDNGYHRSLKSLQEAQDTQESNTMQQSHDPDQSHVAAAL